MQHVPYMYVRLPHFLPYLRMGYCIARIRISCTFVPNVLTTEKSNSTTSARNQQKNEGKNKKHAKQLSYYYIST